jgi:hypothetical protein
MLVTISSVLLRSQTLISSARPINFDPKAPNETAESLPFEVQLSIWIILACITMPFVILFKPISMFKACLMVLKLCWLKLRQLNERRAHFDDSCKSMELQDPSLPLASDASRNDGADLEMDLFADQHVGYGQHSAFSNMSALRKRVTHSTTPIVGPLPAKNREQDVVLADNSNAVARAHILKYGQFEPEAASVHLSIISELFKIPQIKSVPAGIFDFVRASARVVGTPGETLIRKGDFSTFMIYLVVGSLRVVADDEKRFEEVCQGNLVGWEAFFRKCPRSANICCVGHCVFYRFELGPANEALSKEESNPDGLELDVLSNSNSSMPPPATGQPRLRIMGTEYEFYEEC